MKTLLILACALLHQSTLFAGEVITLITSPIVPQPPAQQFQSQSEEISLAEGEVAELSWAPIPLANDYEVNRGYLRFLSSPGRTFDFGLYTIPPKTNGSYIASALPNPVKVSGPGTLKLVSNSRSTAHIATVTVTRTGSGTASNSVVIPQDPAGMFQVILESSADLITWTPVAPGNFSGSTAQRFFRTRIVKR